MGRFSFFAKLVLFFVFLLLLSPRSLANDVQLFLNEFCPNPLGGENEWVEIFNPGKDPVSLQGWSLKDASGRKKSLSALGKVVDFAVFEASGEGWLNNSGRETLVLLNPQGAEVDRVEYGEEEEIGLPQEGESLGRFPDGGSSWQIFSVPSKGSPNTLPSPPPSSTPTDTYSDGGIVLSEFLPNPSEGEEWVEIRNENEFEVNLVDWFIDDVEEGGGRPVKFSLTLTPFGFGMIPVGRYYFNNGGDVIRLLRPDGVEVERYSYNYGERDCSFAKDKEGKWRLTSDPTPGEANSIVSPFSPPTPTPTSTPTSTPTPTPTPTSPSTPFPSNSPSLEGEEISSVFLRPTERTDVENLFCPLVEEVEKGFQRRDLLGWSGERGEEEGESRLSPFFLFFGLGIVLLSGVSFLEESGKINL